MCDVGTFFYDLFVILDRVFMMLSRILRFARLRKGFCFVFKCCIGVWVGWIWFCGRGYDCIDFCVWIGSVWLLSWWIALFF